MLAQRVEDLNGSLEGPASRAQPVPLVVYKDGLQIHSWPFRPATDPSAQGILMDVLDGYFPFILQARRAGGGCPGRVNRMPCAHDTRLLPPAPARLVLTTPGCSPRPLPALCSRHPGHALPRLRRSSRRACLWC